MRTTHFGGFLVFCATLHGLKASAKPDTMKKVDLGWIHFQHKTMTTFVIEAFQWQPQHYTRPPTKNRRRDLEKEMFGLQATRADLRRWKQQHRTELDCDEL